MNKTIEEALGQLTDSVNRPAHYTFSGVEPIDVVEAWALPHHLATAVTYIARAGRKDPNKYLEDLKKAKWYLDRYINNLEAKSK